MTPEARALAAAKAAGRRHRLARIRKTVAVLALASFIALCSGIYVQMAAGRDPVLGAKASASETTKHAKSSPSSVAASPPSSAPAVPTVATQPSPVTTSQS